MIQKLSEITLGQVAGWICVGLLILSYFVEISKIKFNPLSWIAKKIGRAINGEVIEKVDKLEKEVASIDKAVQEKTATDARYRILRFGDECLHDVKHSKEHFDQILADINYYEGYCRNHPDYKNNTAILTIEAIENIYKRRMEARDFD